MLFSGFTFGLSNGLRSWFLGLLVVWCVLWGCLEVTMPLLRNRRLLITPVMGWRALIFRW